MLYLQFGHLYQVFAEGHHTSALKTRELCLIGEQKKAQTVMFLLGCFLFTRIVTSVLHLFCRTPRVYQTFADIAAGSPQPVQHPCFLAEPYLELCWNSHSQPGPGHACIKGPEAETANDCYDSTSEYIQ